MSAAWDVRNNTLTHDDLPEMVPYMVPPYPPGFWYVEDNQLKQDGLLDMVYMGAFYNCTNLRTATISPTVKSIGEYAFANTGLTSVTIASDCTYYPTSFPPGCTISRYLQEE